MPEENFPAGIISSLRFVYRFFILLALSIGVSQNIYA
jgi:hypothetical protein